MRIGVNVTDTSLRACALYRYGGVLDIDPERMMRSPFLSGAVGGVVEHVARRQVEGRICCSRRTAAGTEPFVG